MYCKLYPPLSIHELGQRDNQEDALAKWADRLFVLCDGMGGHEKGEVASQTVCQALVGWFQSHVNPGDAFTDDLLCEAIEYAYTELDKFDDDSPRKMGTTLTVLYIHTQGITAAHIGDSRIYHIRPSSLTGKGGEGAVLYQSRDHSLVFELYQAGEITYEEMATYPQKNIITRAMSPGKANRMRPDIIHITDIRPGDWFYMCSDGMLEQTSNEELLALFSSEASDEEKRNQLTKATANNQDNHTAWLIHVEEVKSGESDKTLENEEPTARCNAINIMPKPIVSDDVQIVDGDDVVMVSTPKPPKRGLPLLKMALAATAFFLALIAVWIFFIRNDDKPELQRPEPMMQVPIKYNKDSVQDTNRKVKHEPAGHQYPVNAPRRNDSTRHLLHR